MKAKLKICAGCNKEELIWKRIKGKPFCKSCASQQTNSTKSLKQKPLKKLSSKQEKLLVAYSTLRETYLKTHPLCMAHLPGCQIQASDIHHKAGRGIYINDSSLFLAVCRICHGQIEADPVMAKNLGFSLSREEIRLKYGKPDKGEGAE